MKSIAAPAPLQERSSRATEALGAAGVAIRSPTLLRAVAFAALASFVTVRWVSLVDNPPIGRGLAAVAVATVGGVALTRIAASTGRRQAVAARSAIVAVTALAGLVVMGLAPRLLFPHGWDELGTGIDVATGAFRTNEWPYSGPEEWIRLGTLLIAPVVLAMAAAFTFWPVRPGRTATRALGAASLVGLYAAAIAQGQPHAPLVAGLVLLGGVAALLFLPGATRINPLPALAMLLVAAVVAVPLAARLPASKPVIDYNALAAGNRATFNWDHTYGPLDWPRHGELVFKAASSAPHYWKAVTLDRFDGFRWVSSATSVAAPESEMPRSPPAAWQVEATMTMGALDGDLLISPGPIIRVKGLDSVAIADDGTARSSDDLGAGRSYTVDAYAPDPTVERMQAAPERVPELLRPYTAVEVPADYGLDYRAASQSSLVEPTLTLPPVARGFGPHTPAVKRILQSPYARTYRLARQLGAGSPTTYGAVVRVQSYLRSHYSYDERPPARQYPLPAFLFQDRIGYCQQFSGAMALLLRMNGIPARVAAGFAPGERQSHGTYEIRDTDAHSWVEVWFSGIGWVPFDPTPASAPAISGTISTTPTAQLGAEGAAAQLRRADTIALRRGHVNPGGVGPTRGGGSAAAPRARGVREAGAGTPTLALGLALAALAGVALARWAWRQRARLASLGEVDEVRAAFAAAGRPVGGATLSELADRLEREGHPRAARYLTALRERRYAPAPAVRRERRARGALRTAVSRGKGPGARIRAWLAVPPRLRPR